MADESNIQSFEEAQQSYGDIFDPEKYMQSYYGEMLKTEVSPYFEFKHARPRLPTLAKTLETYQDLYDVAEKLKF